MRAAVLAFVPVLLAACLPNDPPPQQPPGYYPQQGYPQQQGYYPQQQGYPQQPAPYAQPPVYGYAPYGAAQAPPAPYAPQPQPPAPYYGNAPPAAPVAGAPPAAPPPAAAADSYAAARQRCVDETNAYRAKLGVPAVTARPDKSACSDTDARGDATNGTIHGASGKCGLAAQNECPNWDGTGAAIVSSCLSMMFAEGPGQPYSAHGHYINMTNAEYHSMSCGFYETNGHVWLVQNYFR